MEPERLDPAPRPDAAALEAWLRANAAQPPLPDDGFSQRVLAALPPPRASWITRDQQRTLVFVVLGALAGVIFCYLRGYAFDFAHLDKSIRDGTSALSAYLQSPFDPEQHRQLSLALTACTGSLVIAYFGELRRALGL